MPDCCPYEHGLTWMPNDDAGAGPPGAVVVVGSEVVVVRAVADVVGAVEVLADFDELADWQPLTSAMAAAPPITTRTDRRIALLVTSPVWPTPVTAHRPRSPLGLAEPVRPRKLPIMRVLISHAADQRFGDLFRSTHPEIEWLSAPRAGPPEEPFRDNQFDVAWMSVDLLYDGSGPRFFRALRDNGRLGWVQSSFAGTDHPVFRPLLARGVRIATSHENSISIAEYVLGAVLRAYQRPEQWAAAQAASEWRHHEFEEIYGSTWLILGLGAIGSQIAHRANAFGARTIGVRRSPAAGDEADSVITPDLIHTVLGSADVVVLSRPGSATEPPVVDARFLASMKPSSILVNVARGSLVDEVALLAALDRGQLSLAILDAFATEPLPAESPLWHHPKVVVTPHASSGGLGRHERNARLFLDNLTRFRAGAMLRNEIGLGDLHRGGDAPAQFSDS